MATVHSPITTPVPPQPPKEKTLYEIVRGQRVELPPMSKLATVVASVLGQELSSFAKANKLGWVIIENLFVLNAQAKTIRRPDVAFVSYQRWAKDKPLPDTDNSWAVIPDLAVEVISPTDRAEELIEKIEEYFAAGVQLVWVIYPRRKVVHIYTSPTRMHGLTGDEELDGGNVLSGFKLKLADLFPQ